MSFMQACSHKSAAGTLTGEKPDKAALLEGLNVTPARSDQVRCRQLLYYLLLL